MTSNLVSLSPIFLIFDQKISRPLTQIRRLSDTQKEEKIAAFSSSRYLRIFFFISKKAYINALLIAISLKLLQHTVSTTNAEKKSCNEYNQ